MQISKRAQEVRVQQTRLEVLINDYQAEYGLTDIEILQALTSLQQTMLKYMLRAERNPDET